MQDWALRAWTLGDFAAAPSIRDLDPESTCLASQRRYRLIDRDAVLAAGVDQVDLDLFMDAVRPGHPFDRDYGSVLLLAHLNPLMPERSDLPLRAAINWAMIAEQEHWATNYAMDEFARVGLPEHGWRFLAAGIEPDEAHTFLADRRGVVPLGVLDTMIALRGTTVLGFDA